MLGDLAFELGRHVLVVLANLTDIATCAAGVRHPRRDAKPSRLSRLSAQRPASLSERAGRIKHVAGSLTQLPVLTMPARRMVDCRPDVMLAARLVARGGLSKAEAELDHARAHASAAGNGATVAFSSEPRATGEGAVTGGWDMSSEWEQAVASMDS